MSSSSLSESRAFFFFFFFLISLRSKPSFSERDLCDYKFRT